MQSIIADTALLILHKRVTERPVRLEIMLLPPLPPSSLKFMVCYVLRPFGSSHANEDWLPETHVLYIGCAITEAVELVTASTK
jgi:hypothetical protein